VTDFTRYNEGPVVAARRILLNDRVGFWRDYIGCEDELDALIQQVLDAVEFNEANGKLDDLTSELHGAEAEIQRLRGLLERCADMLKEVSRGLDGVSDPV
jgi:hypothetical protein